MITFAEVGLGSGGVASCVKCAGGRARTFRTSVDVVADITAAARGWEAGGLEGPGPNVLLGGAEPFSHPELPLLVASAVEAGVRRVGLTTDGGALSVAENAAGVVHAGVRRVDLVLLGPAEIHDALTGRPGLFDAALEGARGFLRAAEDACARAVVTGRVPVCAHNLEHAAGAVAALASAGAVAVTLVVSAEGTSSGRARLAIESAVDTGVTSGVWVDVAVPEGAASSDPAVRRVTVAPRVAVGG